MKQMYDGIFEIHIPEETIVNRFFNDLAMVIVVKKADILELYTRIKNNQAAPGRV